MNTTTKAGVLAVMDAAADPSNRCRGFVSAEEIEAMKDARRAVAELVEAARSVMGTMYSTDEAGNALVPNAEQKRNLRAALAAFSEGE